MAASEDRAARIRELKDSRPDLTWDRIADFVDVKERSAIQWVRSGGITHDNCVTLARLFDVDPEWLWSGREAQEGTVDLMTSLSRGSQLDRIEAKLDELLARTATSLRTPEEIAAEAAQQRGGTKRSSRSSGGRKQEKDQAA